MITLHAIFNSISGEGGFFQQGAFCSLIRFQGCNLKCSWCDTQRATVIGPGHGDPHLIKAIMKANLHKHVLITGGEPLLQRAGLQRLVKELYYSGRLIQIETNGTLSPLYYLNDHIGYVVDYKTPSSSMHESMHPVKEFVDMWAEHRSMVKFVIADVADLTWSISRAKLMQRYGYNGRFLFSPVDGDKGLVASIVSALRTAPQLIDKVTISLQLHKLVDMP